MNYTFTIPDRLPGMNQFIAELKKDKMAGAKMKGEEQAYVSTCIGFQLKKLHIDNPVKIHYVFYEKTRNRDLDNIAGFAHKVIQDALVECRVIKNDGWAYVVGFTDNFKVDGRNPRIEVTLEEIERIENDNAKKLQRNRRASDKAKRSGQKGEGLKGRAQGTAGSAKRNQLRQNQLPDGNDEKAPGN